MRNNKSKKNQKMLCDTEDRLPSKDDNRPRYNDQRLTEGKRNKIQTS